jgi:peptidoglycan/LPS O-acetylase OafA/YrhL
MTTISREAHQAARRTTTRQRVGLALAAVMAAINLPSALFPTPDGEAGPPFSILLADTLFSVVALVAVVWVWRTGNRTAKRVLAASLIVLLLTALPGLFVDIPALLKAGIGAVTVLVLISLVLVFSGERRTGDDAA